MRKINRCLPVLVSMILVPTFAQAQTSTSIITHSLDRTALWVQPYTRSATVINCDGCYALTPLFNTPGLVGFSCLQPAGTQCIYVISVEAPISVANNVITGNFFGCTTAIFLRVDNLPATPGPPGVIGFGAARPSLLGVVTQLQPPTTVDLRPTRVSAVAVVTNAVANQLHSITLNLWAIGECTATAQYAIATIQVYH